MNPFGEYETPVFALDAKVTHTSGKKCRVYSFVMWSVPIILYGCINMDDESDYFTASQTELVLT